MECFMFDNFYDMIAVVVLARMVDDIDKKVSFSWEWRMHFGFESFRFRWKAINNKIISNAFRARADLIILISVGVSRGYTDHHQGRGIP